MNNSQFQDFFNQIALIRLKEPRLRQDQLLLFHSGRPKE